MDTSTISMAIFHGHVSHYQRVSPGESDRREVKMNAEQAAQKAAAMADPPETIPQRCVPGTQKSSTMSYENATFGVFQHFFGSHILDSLVTLW